MAKKQTAPTEPKADQTTGILLIACGHKNYTRMACMLAASIRGNGCELPITLATDENQIPSGYEIYFTDVKLIKQEHYTLNGNVCYIKTKCHINEISPYDNTLFLDADIILINNGKINSVLQELASVDFALKNSGFVPMNEITDKNANQWANTHAVRDAYKLTTEKVWSVHSEFIWWKRTPETKALFSTWVDTFENLKVNPTTFAGCIPDELPLWIAMCKTGIEPHKSHYKPTFWPMFGDGSRMIKDLRNDYIGISIGGRVISPQQKLNYDNLCQIHQRILGFKYLFKCQPKYLWLAERKESNF